VRAGRLSPTTAAHELLAAHGVEERDESDDEDGDGAASGGPRAAGDLSW
jgi:hypothetical protein